MRTILLIAIAWLVASCAAAPSKAPLLADLIEREAEDLEPTTVRSREAGFSTRILGSLQDPVEVDEDGAYMVIDIGTVAPVECVVFNGDLDLASALQELSIITDEEIEAQIGKKIDSKEIYKVAAIPVDAAPTFSLEWLYKLDGAAGHMKHRIASVDDRAVYCTHNESGYRETFAELFEVFVRNFESDTPGEDGTFYTIVTLIKMAGVPLGIDKQVYKRIEEGDVRVEHTASMLVPRNHSTLVASDSVDVHFALDNGALINAVHIRSENGEIITNLALDPTETGWRVSGILKEKNFETTIEEDVLVASLLGQERAVRATIADPSLPRHFEMNTWLAEASPERLTTVSVEVGEQKADSQYEVTSQVGELRVVALLDEEGETRSAKARIGHVEMNMEVVYTEGAP